MSSEKAELKSPEKAESTSSSEEKKERQQTLSAQQQQQRRRQQQQHTGNHGSGNGPGPTGLYPFPNWGAQNNHDRDDDSFRYMSEPSLSEEGDSSTADHHILLSASATSGDEDDDDDDDEGGKSTPPPPPPGPPPPVNASGATASSGMQSPGNTSLSSRESHFRPLNSRFQRVKIHFSPDSAQSEHNQYPYYRQPQNFYQNQPTFQQQQQQQQQYSQLLYPMNHAAASNQQGGSNKGQTSDVHQNDTNNDANAPSSSAFQNDQGDDAANPNHDMSYSTFSYSTLSSLDTKDRKQLDDFMLDLRQSSEGALQEAEANVSYNLNTSTESSQYPKGATLNTVLRNTAAEEHHDNQQHHDNVPAGGGGGRHRRISSVDTELIGNTSDVHLDDNDELQEADDTRHSSPIMMNLSLSDDDERKEHNSPIIDDEAEEDLKNGRKGTSSSEKDANSQSSSKDDGDDAAKGSGRSTGNNSGTQISESNNTSNEEDPDHGGGESDQQQHSADDEQTEFRPPRKRVFNVAGGKPSPAHRRTRSGDSAAAAIATGGMDWRGMDKDRIPLPIADEDEDDEDDIVESGKNSKAEAGQDNNNNKGRNGKKSTGNNGNGAEFFSIGAADAATANRAAARKQRREQRQEHRLLAEKAAAAARDRRITKQYQDSSNSPLWNYGRKQRGRVDSHDNASLGSIPSTIMHTTEGQNNGDYDRPRPRLSLDASAISNSTGDFAGMSRRDSESMFSWISTSHHNDADSHPFTGPGLSLSPSPRRQRHSLQMHPHWLQQAGSPPGAARHQRAHTAIGGYPPMESQMYARAADPQRQESFRRYIQQENEAQNHDSFQRFSEHYSPQSTTTPPLVSTVRQGKRRSSGDNALGRYPNPLSQSHSSSTSGSGSDSGSYSTDSGEMEDEARDIHTHQVLQMHPNAFNNFSNLNEVEQSVEAELLRHGSYQHVVRHAKSSPFANFGRKTSEATGSRKFDKASFLPKTSVIGDNEQKYPTYRCPRCQTVQREFFSVASAPRQYETASGYLALYFSIYVIASLYIFGMEENWPAIDCIYFAVITLTTAGLGDFVPTTDSNKIICSIFIYFGVACIGLLLGTYIAGMLDESSRRKAKENRLKSCPNCARLQNIKDVAERRQLSMQPSIHSNTQKMHPPDVFASERLSGSVSDHPMSPSDHPMFPSEQRLSGFGSEVPYFSSERPGVQPEPLEYDHAAKKIKRQHDRQPSQSSFGSSSPKQLRSPANSENNSAVSNPNFSKAPLTFSPNSYISPAVTNRKVPTPVVPATIPEMSATSSEQKETSDDERQRTPTSAAKKDSPPPPPPPRKQDGMSSETARGAMLRRSPPSIVPRSPGLPSPMTHQILGRQSHTRHASIDINGGFSYIPSSEARIARKFTFDGGTKLPTPTISENTPFEFPGTPASAPNQGGPNHRPSAPPNFNPSMRFDSFRSGADSTEGDSSVISSDSYDSDKQDLLEMSKARVKTAKYVFLTLKQALMNSLVIIGVGCMGFYFIERFSLVDSWYFTTVLLTTVGYGDIVPVTKGGKLFSTVYILVAGTILLNNMSLISMIPLELRKRRIERAVLTQFGDLLDDDALRELATGPLIQRLNLATNRPDGLNECTREMFALAMLVRLGKVTEDDILETFAAFNRLDVNNDGVLNSRSIIAGMIHKRRRHNNNMRRVASTNSMTKGSQAHAPQPLYTGVSNEFAPSGVQTETPRYWTAHPPQDNNPTRFMDENPAVLTEESALLRGGGGYGTTHSRARSR